MHSESDAVYLDVAEVYGVVPEGALVVFGDAAVVSPYFPVLAVLVGDGERNGGAAERLLVGLRCVVDPFVVVIANGI